MLVFRSRLWVWVCLILPLSSCSTISVKPELSYSRDASLRLYALEQWLFSGRLALTGKDDSWSANIAWEHKHNNEQIKLSGPLGQGATIIRLTDESVTIDGGDGKVRSSTQPEIFINQQLGLFVPVRSLRYWVLGLPEPTQAFTELSNGFRQSGWRVEFKQMQLVEKLQMPYKITVMNEQAKLKLIIDQWTIDGTDAR